MVLPAIPPVDSKNAARVGDIPISIANAGRKAVPKPKQSATLK